MRSLAFRHWLALRNNYFNVMLCLPACISSSTIYFSIDMYALGSLLNFFNIFLAISKATYQLSCSRKIYMILLYTLSPASELIAFLTKPMKSPKISSMLSQAIHIFSLSFMVWSMAIDFTNCSLIWSGVTLGLLINEDMYWRWLYEESLARTIDW